MPRNNPLKFGNNPDHVLVLSYRYWSQHLLLGVGLCSLSASTWIMLLPEIFSSFKVFATYL